MVYTKKEADIKDFGRVLYSDAPFDKSVEAIESKNGQIITMSGLAYARMQKGVNHSVSQNGSYVREGDLFVPNDKHKRILLRNSLVLEHPIEATQAHRESHEYFPGNNFIVQDFLGKLKEGKDYLILDNLKPIPHLNFGEDERTVFLFAEHAKDYGLFLKDALKNSGVTQMSFYMNNDDKYIDKQRQPFANQLWLHWLDFDSDISGDGRSLDDDNGVRGVQSIGEADALKKIVVETYTSKQVQNIVNKTLQSVGISGSTKKIIILDLEKRLK
jgi:hypothetical protein